MVLLGEIFFFNVSPLLQSFKVRSKMFVFLDLRENIQARQLGKTSNWTTFTRRICLDKQGLGKEIYQRDNSE